ncbi:cupin domain-containing protein [Nocardia rhizosphaerae]|uniref:Cupin domain-containing protein n=1 Tax=Nocardia rhizosphaerae TaxID=1691571 RepID=A0ABV8L1X8_9NOCA
MRPHPRMSALATVGAVSAALVTGFGVALPASIAQTGDQDGMILQTPDDLDWQPGPASLPAGVEYVLLEGDPSADDFFTMRLKFPDGYQVQPHMHSRTERVTVLSGTANFGHGEAAAWDKTTSYPAGSYLSIAPDTAHYVAAEGETIVQLNASGPWTITYVNPADDPRGSDGN